jgi:AcrR family transcriptional regulator
MHDDSGQRLAAELRSEMTSLDMAPAPAPAPARAPLRERKKLATRRALQRVALDLVSQRGFAHVTVEDIAEAADVSPRTFFNYFPSKEAVLFGASPDRTEAVRDAVVHGAPGESALTALSLVLTDELRHRAEELWALGGDAASWLRRMKSAQADPHLRAAQASHMATGERLMAEALAERLGTDPDRDPYPGLLAAAATAVMRSTQMFWAASGGEVPLDELGRRAWAALAAGLPEDTDLRTVLTGTARADTVLAADTVLTTGTQADTAQARGREDDHS